MAATRDRTTTPDQIIRASVRVDDASGCWLWTRAKDGLGYGMTSFHGRGIRAHRLSFAAFVSPIPDGQCVLHRCDRPSCVNPDHLFLGTRLDNNADRTRKGRTARGEAHHWRVLTEDNVRSIRREYATGQWTPGALGDQYGVARSTINAVVGNGTKMTWRHVR